MQDYPTLGQMIKNGLKPGDIVRMCLYVPGTPGEEYVELEGIFCNPVLEMQIGDETFYPLLKDDRVSRAFCILPKRKE